MRCHIATAVTVRTDAPRNPLRVVLKSITNPLSDGLNLAEHLIAGAVASGAAVASMHPMDTIKTVVQAANKPTVKLGTFSALSTTLRQGGLPALYKGVGISLGGQVPAGAIKFAAFETLTQFVANITGNKNTGPIVDFSCGALAFLACSVVLVPAELMKQRLQAGMYPAFTSGVKTILQTEGPKALYTGYGATLLRDVPYTMLEFGLYSQFKKIFRAVVNKSKLTPQEEITLGGIAGGCTGFITTPLDLAKTRLMTQASSGSQRQYKGVIDVLAKVAQKEGFSGLFKGSTARVAWLIPFTAVFFGVHEASKRALLNRKVTTATAAKPKTS
ncbi:putative S-adenosylmethionine carrier 2, chloroplastic [Gracilariopsis chorda]|uniref:Putative S-adenosylmethionine carrier 2, chloroplastic n=1 Tax=Gracilariopsis chorda TaxID=448386 RepID=A0A2V3IRC0_9FLOR|nr:putative S-adenosylmethionine carrier 2, chloroplastic [Gracilariopsis chorda]|eukprot:PXF44644.1 putative S-adenosylmethionine carrier 2, chloroplastic [Gracilariopsis chorda]